MRAARIAFSYLGALAAAVTAGLLAVLASPLAAPICRSTEDATCLLGWTFGSTIVAFALTLAGVAWILRLGWEWWAVVAGLLLGSPWWLDAAPAPAAWVAPLLAPALAGAATFTGAERPPWRPWVIGVASLTLVGAGLVSVFA